MQTRREFLISTASALALTACAGPIGASKLAGARRRTRYVVSTQSVYWTDQDLSDFTPDHVYDLPGAAKFDRSQPYSMITAVNDDGTGVKRIFLPLHYHCATGNPHAGLIYLMGNHRPSACVALDADSLEVVRVEMKPSGTDVRNFGGHGVMLAGGDAMAFTMNNFELGKYDQISIRDSRSLKELNRFSTYGFQVHEIRLTEDKKYFVCAHYGSYLGQGPYKDLGVYSGSAYTTTTQPKIIYPASVTFVDASSGSRFRLLSDKKAGQEGHATSDAEYGAYLPNEPAVLHSRAGLETHPRFQEGKATKEDGGEFAVTQQSYGISLIYDPKFREVLVPNRVVLLMNITDTTSKKAKMVDLYAQTQELGLKWDRTKQDYVSGIEFHPDGKHYILSTSDGFVAVERGTHKINPAMTFHLPLKIHSHMYIT